MEKNVFPAIERARQTVLRRQRREKYGSDGHFSWENMEHSETKLNFSTGSEKTGHLNPFFQNLAISIDDKMEQLDQVLKSYSKSCFEIFHEALDEYTEISELLKVKSIDPNSTDFAPEYTGKKGRHLDEGWDTSFHDSNVDKKGSLLDESKLLGSLPNYGKPRKKEREVEKAWDISLYAVEGERKMETHASIALDASNKDREGERNSKKHHNAFAFDSEQDPALLSDGPVASKPQDHDRKFSEACKGNLTQLKKKMKGKNDQTTCRQPAAFDPKGTENDNYSNSNIKNQVQGEQYNRYSLKKTKRPPTHILQDLPEEETVTYLLPEASVLLLNKESLAATADRLENSLDDVPEGQRNAQSPNCKRDGAWPEAGDFVPGMKHDSDLSQVALDCSESMTNTTAQSTRKPWSPRSAKLGTDGPQHSNAIISEDANCLDPPFAMDIYYGPQETTSDIETVSDISTPLFFSASYPDNPTMQDAKSLVLESNSHGRDMAEANLMPVETGPPQGMLCSQNVPDSRIHSSCATIDQDSRRSSEVYSDDNNEEDVIRQSMSAKKFVGLAEIARKRALDAKKMGK